MDLGVHKKPVYSQEHNTNTTRLQWISQASSQQRKGRTGRTCNGVVIRLYPAFIFDRHMNTFDEGVIRTGVFPEEYLRVAALSGSRALVALQDKVARRVSRHSLWVLRLMEKSDFKVFF